MARSAQVLRIRARDVARIAVGWGACVGLLVAGPLLEPSVPTALLAGVLVAIVVVITVCAFGVVGQAEALAHRLGDPYGSLVLTLSIVLIEVVLISAVMLGPGEHATIARDSVMAVAMIIMNLVIGLSLLLGGLRHGGLAHNCAGTSAYLSMLAVLVPLALVLPAFVGTEGSYAVAQEVPVVVLTLGAYAFFLRRQTGAQAADFQEVGERSPDPSRARGDEGAQPLPIGRVLAGNRREIAARILALIAMAIPIVLLAHDMAVLLDDGLSRVGAPPALAGLLIAMIVFLPESLTAVRAALAGEIQRVSNLCHGALVSTVGLTVPAVLLIGAATGQTVVLGESPANLAMLGTTMLLSVATFAARRVTAIHGAAHLVLFAAYAVTLLG
ncbi:calcium:proton antiporter [Schaalia naturae]|uniref:Calcium:proton antiporter n=1 Tax=Schaalia naturae TaxID=635203 RepID=A0ABW2SJP2_9ACTO